MKALRIFLLILIVVGIILLCTQKLWVPKLVDQILLSEAKKSEKGDTSKKITETLSPILITSKDIKEINFSGSMPIISGSRTVAVKARGYVEKEISDFKESADKEVPDLIKEFGDNPPSKYAIDIEAKYVKGEKVESIVISVYIYTGGAHGSTTYKVFSASTVSGKILSISDIIKKDKQETFVSFVDKELNDWRPDGESQSVVFDDSIKDLTFDSFSNWSLDNKNLTIYFDQYQIGPGVLGTVAFPISLDKIRDFLQL